MINIILGIFLVGAWIAVFSAGRRIDKLKQKVDDNKELIRDLYRIDDERLLHSKAD